MRSEQFLQGFSAYTEKNCFPYACGLALFQVDYLKLPAGVSWWSVIVKQGTV